jgi:hypothetical protein
VVINYGFSLALLIGAALYVAAFGLVSSGKAWPSVGTLR